LGNVLAAAEAQKKGTVEDWQKAKQEEIQKVCSGDLPVSCQVMAAAEFSVIALPLLPEWAVTTGTIGGTANTSIQYLLNDSVNPTDVIFAFWTGAATANTGFWGTVGWNAGMGGAASAVKGDDIYSMGSNIAGSAIGAGVGYGAGKLLTFTGNKIGQWVTSEFNPKFNPKLQEGANKGLLGLSKDLTPHPLPGVVGNAGSALGTEITNSQAQKGINYVKDKMDEPKK
jgi:filamentous hemagglutinin